MPRKARSLADLLKAFRFKHGNTFDYDVVDTSSESYISIRCKDHGWFRQKVKKHLEGQGCKRCAAMKANLKWVHVTGFRDELGRQIQMQPYTVWRSIMQRVKPDYWVKHPHYQGVQVSENFKSWDFYYEWCLGQVGFGCKDDLGFPYELDKDLLSNGRPTYSEQTCCFLPRSLNYAIAHRDPSEVLRLGMEFANDISFEACLGIVRFVRYAECENCQ